MREQDHYYTQDQLNNAGQAWKDCENIDATSNSKYTDTLGREWFRIDTKEFKNLASHGKINAIRHLREIFGLGLVNAKEIIDNVTQTQRKDQTKELISKKLQECANEAFAAGLTKSDISSELRKLGF